MTKLFSTLLRILIPILVLIFLAFVIYFLATNAREIINGMIKFESILLGV